MRHRRIITLALAGILIGASAVPAFAQTEDKLTGLDRARQAAQQALEYGANETDAASPTVPPGHAEDGPGKGNQGRANQGNANPGKGTAHTGDSDKLTGRARAAAAIANALARGNGNGNAFGRGHALEVIEMLRDGKTPDTLDAENHGAEVTAMVRAYNELKARERATG